jgi:predicted membrane protein
MEQNENKPDEQMMQHWEKQHRRGRFFAGLLVIGAGLLFLAREMGAMIPSWIFTWQIFLIVFGLFILLKSGFRNFGGFIMILVGSAFLVRDHMPEYDFAHYLWPIALITVGIFIILRPRCGPGRQWHRNRYRQYRDELRQHRQQWQQTPPTKDDFLDITTIFGSVKKNIISKDFRGGEITCVCAGGEIDLTQSDIEGRIELEVNAVFGGVRILVPAHWEIKSELTAVLGGVEDKRHLHNSTTTGTKLLVLRGTAVLGGIEIRSF